MAKLTLTNVANITGAETTALNTINNNSQAIETALENTLSLDGTSPNTMLADLDMNENDLLNVGAITADSLTLDGVAIAADSIQAVGPQGPTGATGAQGPAGTTSPVATTSVTGTVTLGTFAQAIAGSPTGAYAPTLDIIKQIIDMVCPVGTVSGFFQTTAPTYWLILDGQTIGDGSSGATSRANADTIYLFTQLWNGTTNAELSIQTSGGVPSTRGISAAADFAAHKRLPLPNALGAFLRGSNQGATGTDPLRVVATTQTDLTKAHVHTGSTDSQGNHSHTWSFGAGAYYGANSNGPKAAWSAGDTQNSAATGSGAVTTAGAHTHTVTVDSTGGTETRPYNLSILYCIRY